MLNGKILKMQLSSLLCLSMLCALVGCQKGSIGSSDSNESSSVPTVEASVEVTEQKETSGKNTDETVKESEHEDKKEKQEVEDDTVVETQAASETKDLSIYCINDDVSDKDIVTVSIPKDAQITSRLITDSVVAEFQNHNLEIGIDDVTEKDGTVIVSFKSNMAPVQDVGAGVECIILDCISQSILDDVPSAKQIIFRVEGKAYETGHLYYGLNEVYLWK